MNRLEPPHRAVTRATGVPLAIVAGLSLAAFACVSGEVETTSETRYGLPVPAPPVTSVARSDFGMVATGSPEATKAAAGILERGGNAIDAAVAAALMLGVADPDASGLGGMTHMVIHLDDGSTLVIDGTAPTPQDVDAGRLLELNQADRLVGHEVVAVPTTLAVIDRARSRYGTMDMASLLAPSIEVAERGYRINPAQIVWSNYYHDLLQTSGYLRSITFKDGYTLGQVGDVVCRPDLSRTLRHIARHGVSSFYRGVIADMIEADMIRDGGFLRKSDLAALRVKEVRPLHTTYRGFDVFTVPIPGGGTPLIEALNILETFASEFLAENTVARHHVVLETCRIALADRSLTLARTGSIRREVSPALSRDLARERADMIELERLIPESELRGPIDPECTPSGESTTQVSVVDRWGNVVSLTQTLGRSWGAKVATPGLGFPYNNMLENFNYDKPQCPGYLHPRAPGPTDMAPTVVLGDDGSLLAALGSPGSDLIPSIIVNVVSNLVDRGMGLEEAMEFPRVLFGGVVELVPFIEVAPPITAADIDALEAMGHKETKRCIYPAETISIVRYGGVNAVGWDADAMTFVGVGDGRRWGSAKGPRVVADRPEAP